MTVQKIGYIPVDIDSLKFVASKFGGHGGERKTRAAFSIVYANDRQ